MLDFIIKTLLAHFLGDFVFQSDKAVVDVSQNKFKSKYLYWHYGIHFVLLWLFTQKIWGAILLSTVHILIDIFTKFYLPRYQKKIELLVLDQVLHFISIGVFVYFFHPYTINWDLVFNTQLYLFLMTLVCITYVSSVIIKMIMSKFVVTDTLGVENAGKIIGMLERLFIFGFVVTHFWEGIGFLLAAKSIFRFGDLKENKDMKLTEYILIGTLLSFGLAIFISMLYLKLKYYI